MKLLTIALGVILVASASTQWTVVNLHPAWAEHSLAYGVEGGQQVGVVQFIGGGGEAGMWSGTASSYVSLRPPGAAWTEARGVGDGQQVGHAVFGANRAGLWTGTPGSWVDLQPAVATHSHASGVGGGQQVGIVHLSGGGSPTQASLWTGTAASWINLNPTGASESWAYDVDGGQQVGMARVGGPIHAGLWNGTASSWVDLNPAGASGSQAFGVQNGYQVGYADVGGIRRASMWSGAAWSWVDLRPAVATESIAYGVHASQQVGYAVVGGLRRASLWTGSAASWVDLSSSLPVSFGTAEAKGVDHIGAQTYVVGDGFNTATGRYEAVLWVSRSIAPTSYSMVRGTVFAGNLVSLLDSDNDRFVMRPGPVFSSSEPPIQVRVNGNAPTASPNGFSFSLESSASFGNAEQKVWLWNYVLGGYELLDTRLATTADTAVTMTVRTDPSRFVQSGTLAIRALVSFRAIGPAFAYPWSGRIDKVWWDFPG